MSNLYKLRDKITGDVAYYRAHTKAGAKNRHTDDRFVVEPLSIDEALTLAPTDIIDATVEVHPDQAPLALTVKPA